MKGACSTYSYKDFVQLPAQFPHSPIVMPCCSVTTGCCRGLMIMVYLSTLFLVLVLAVTRLMCVVINELNKRIHFGVYIWGYTSKFHRKDPKKPAGWVAVVSWIAVSGNIYEPLIERYKFYKSLIYMTFSFLLNKCYIQSLWFISFTSGVNASVRGHG